MISARRAQSRPIRDAAAHHQVGDGVEASRRPALAEQAEHHREDHEGGLVGCREQQGALGDLPLGAGSLSAVSSTTAGAEAMGGGCRRALQPGRGRRPVAQR